MQLNFKCDETFFLKEMRLKHILLWKCDPNIFFNRKCDQTFSSKGNATNTFPSKGIATRHFLQKKCDQHIFSYRNCDQTYSLKEMRPTHFFLWKCDKLFPLKEMRQDIFSKGIATKNNWNSKLDILEIKKSGVQFN